MKEKSIFKVSKASLLEHLIKVSKAVKGKSILPIYGYVLFEVSDQVLTITGTDTSIQIDSSIGILETSGDMSFCVDISIIDILKTLPEQPLDIEVTKEDMPDTEIIKVNVNIIYSSGNVVLNGDDSQYFSKMKDVDGKGFEIKASHLKRGLDKTKKFAYNDPQRPAASSVFFDIQDDSLTFASTDNKVVSRFIDYSIKGIDAESFILHLDSANILSFLLTGFDDEIVTVLICDKNVLFSVSGIKLTSRLVEGKYLNYNKVFRENLPIELKAECKYLSNVVSRLLNVSDKTSTLLRVETGLMQTHLFAKDMMFNKSADELIECECNGEIIVGMHGKILQDMLSVIEGGVVLSFSNASSPIQLTPANQEEESNLTMLVMPLLLD